MIINFITHEINRNTCKYHINLKISYNICRSKKQLPLNKILLTP